jgi:hypothetical protein
VPTIGTAAPTIWQLRVHRTVRTSPRTNSNQYPTIYAGLFTSSRRSRGAPARTVPGFESRYGGDFAPPQASGIRCSAKESLRPIMIVRHLSPLVVPGGAVSPILAGALILVQSSQIDPLQVDAPQTIRLSIVPADKFPSFFSGTTVGRDVSAQRFQEFKGLRTVVIVDYGERRSSVVDACGRTTTRHASRCRESSLHLESSGRSRVLHRSCSSGLPRRCRPR